MPELSYIGTSSVTRRKAAPLSLFERVLSFDWAGVKKIVAIWGTITLIVALLFSIYAFFTGVAENKEFNQTLSAELSVMPATDDERRELLYRSAASVFEGQETSVSSVKAALEMIQGELQISELEYNEVRAIILARGEERSWLDNGANATRILLASKDLAGDYLPVTGVSPVDEMGDELVGMTEKTANLLSGDKYAIQIAFALNQP